MSTYFVKNIDADPIIMEFNDDSTLEIAPGAGVLCEGRASSALTLQQFVDAGMISVWLIKADEPETVATGVAWQTEGF